MTGDSGVKSSGVTATTVDAASRGGDSATRTLSTGETCSHERSHITDSRFHGKGYSCPASRKIFCDVCRLQRWLDIEVALAECQAELGIIPAEAPERMRKVAHIELFDLDAVQRGMNETGHSLVPLLRELERHCGGYIGQFIHHGATTQDIQDTGMVLEMRDVLDAVEERFNFLPQLGRLAAEHRHHIIMGRTHAQPALPTTFGLKVAGWIDELLRHRRRLHASRERILVAQLYGGVGTLAGFGDAGPELAARFAERLGLHVPALGWHVIRDRVAEFVANMAMLAATLARIADEIRILCRPEFQELEEHWSEKQIGSSTMPHKRNPEKSEQVVVLARLARAQVPLSLEGMILEHERDYRGTRLEWPAVTDVSHYTLTALEILRNILSGLQVHNERMRGTAEERAEAVCTEAMMLTLGAMVGKQRAFRIVHSLSQEARTRNHPLVELAKQTPSITSLIGKEQLDRIFDPTSHLGSAPELVDCVLEQLATEFALPEVPMRTEPAAEMPATRYQERHNLVLKVDYGMEDEFHTNYLTDLSEGGMRLRTTEPLKPGERITVRISFAEMMRPLEIAAEVRSVDPNAKPATAGVAFLDMNKETRAQLDALLRASSTKQPPNLDEQIQCVIFEKDEMLQQIFVQEVQDLAEYHGHLHFETRLVSTVEEWKRVTRSSTKSSLAVVDLDGLGNWEAILEEPLNFVLIGQPETGRKLRESANERIMFLEKPLRFGLLLRTIATLLRL